jgi:predicted acylesterase/phospholipase RssA
MGVVPTGDDQCRFDYLDLEKAIKSVVKEKFGDENVTMAGAQKRSVKLRCGDVSSLPTLEGCRTFVVATRGLVANGPPVLLRSYDCKGHMAENCAIWEAARATSAAPSFFKPISISDVSDSTKEHFIDGGVAHNNPAEVALTEARNIWTRSKRFCLLSIGTGREKTIKFAQTHNAATMPEESQSNPTRLTQIVNNIPVLSALSRTYQATAGLKALMNIARACVDLSNSSERVHERVFTTANSTDGDARFPYHRFNADRDLDKIGLHEWKKVPEIIALTRKYMSEGVSVRNMEQCVEWILRPPEFIRK